MPAMVTNWQSTFLVAFSVGETLAILGAGRMRALGRGGPQLLGRLEALAADGKAAEASWAALESWPSAVGEAFAARQRGVDLVGAGRRAAWRALAVAVFGALLPLAAFPLGIRIDAGGLSERAPGQDVRYLAPQFFTEFFGWHDPDPLSLGLLMLLPWVSVAFAVRRLVGIRRQLARLSTDGLSAPPLAPTTWGDRTKWLLALALACAAAVCAVLWRSRFTSLWERARDYYVIPVGLLGLALLAVGVAVLGSPARGLSRRMGSTSWAAHLILLCCGPNLAVLPVLGIGLVEQMVSPLVGGVLYLSLIIAIGSRHLLVDPENRRVLVWRGPLGLRARVTCARPGDCVVTERREHETKNRTWWSTAVILQGTPPLEVADVSRDADDRAREIAQALGVPVGRGAPSTSSGGLDGSAPSGE